MAGRDPRVGGWCFSSILLISIAVAVVATGRLTAQAGPDSGGPIITEFMAVNSGTLADEDGQFSDWIEIHNPAFVPVDVEGWSLTDDASDLTRWRFPAVEIAPGGFLIVFASGKDRRAAGSELHTNFRLGRSGEYLALVRPDGVTIAHEFDYPEQLGDISYGVFDRIEENVMVPGQTDARVLVPTGPGVGAEWTGGAEPFDDSAWIQARTGIGYDRASPTDRPLFDGVESFDALELGEVDGQSSWQSSGAGASVVRDPARADNKTLAVSEARTRASGALLVAEGTTSTVFFRLRFSAGADVSVGLSASSRPTSARHFETQVRVLHESADAPVAQIEIRDRSDAYAAGELEPETWYGVWMVVDAMADTYELFLAGGGLDGQIQASGPAGQTSFAFRNGQGDDDLIQFYLRAESGHEGAILIDDIHISEGANLANPTTSYRGFIDPAGDLEPSLHEKGTSVYVRIPFFLESPLLVDSLTLRMQYDDGFAAYLNGAEVARRGAPDPLRWDSAATGERSNADAVVVERIDITDASGLLRERGLNVLAVHGLNADAADGDLLVRAELVGARELGRSEQFFTRPTPGGPNRSGSNGSVADLVFSVPAGFQDGPVEVAISTETPGAEIRYTTDASTPSETNGEIYTGPILITSTTPLRAIAFRDGLLPTRVITRSYLFLDDIIARDNEPPGYPTSWRGDAGNQQADYEMDPEITENPAYRDLLDDSFLAIPTFAITTDIEHLFDPSTGIYQNATLTGVAWERPASVELIYPDGRPGFQENAGLRIQGGASRNLTRSPKRSLRLLFKGIYGASKLRFPLFDRGNPVESFDTIILRAGFNQSWIHHNTFLGDNRGRAQYIRDQWAKDTQRAMGHPAPHNTYAHVFLNGIYWGLYNPTERPDATFGEAYLGGDKEDYDAINSGEAVDGDVRAYNDMFTIAARGLADEPSYQAFQEILDLDPFIDYMILHTYGANLDWDSHNWYAIRHRDGGKWQYISWDSEFLFIGLQDNQLNLNEARGPSGLLQRLKANDEFRLRFADHVQRLFFNGGVLTPEKVVERWDERSREVFEPLVAESARWGDYRRDVHRMGGPFELLERDVHWVRERSRLLEDYFPQRGGIVVNQYRSAGLYPATDAPVFSQHGGNIESGFRLSMGAVVAGTIYYTLDGTDPRLAGGEVAPGAEVAAVAELETLLPSGAPVRAHVPANGDLGLDWTQESFDDTGWREGTTGVGYEERTGFEELIGTDVIDEMLDKQSSVYLRIPFTVEEAGDFSFLLLAMKYDDGFVAYLNGEPVASRNAPEAPSWDSTADGSRRDGDAVEFETIDITAHRDLLRSGRNVLAIHGFNSRSGDSDLLILPELRVSRSESSAITLLETTRVKARTLDDGGWSALNEAVFVVDAGLRVTEIMYNPAPGPDGSPYEPDEFEFIELQNVSRRPLDLTGVRLAKGIEFDFSESAVTRLEPGELVVVVENLEAFSSRYDVASIPVAGEYRGRLSNQGEEVALVGALGETMLEFRFEDDWNRSTDGDGASLVIVSSRIDIEEWGREESWRASGFALGSPGVDESLAPAGGLQVPGDADQSGGLSLADPILILRHLAGAPVRLPCEGESLSSGANRDLLDVNGDRGVDLSDAVHLLGYLFQRGPAPAAGTDCVAIEGCAEACTE